jgi:cellulose synthase/poly-beta-1,6-N-acetylglucosamine synthase-like glycosyltransferase
MRASGYIKRNRAKQRGLAFCNLENYRFDLTLYSTQQLQYYLTHQLLPLKPNDAGEVQIAMVEPYPQAMEWVDRHYPQYEIVQTSPLDIHRALMRIFPEELSHQSIYGLAQAHPISSASTLFQQYRHMPMLIVMALAVIALSFAPGVVLSAFLLTMCLFHLLTLSFKSLLLIVGQRKRMQLWNRHRVEPALLPSELPSYSILIPLYKEARIVPQMIQAMRQMDYPKHLLDIKLIVESDDEETIAAIIAEKPEGYFEIIRVPYSLPRTKPKACNYALRFARGDLITIYDAEDKPEPDQLRRVAHRFHYGDNDLVCVQCRLNYYNRPKNLLTKLFSIEYAVWFDFMIPGLNAMHLPIPLGGTSNHIDRKKLIEMGEWDPFNVTEDADLGIRMASFRYRTDILQSQTLEEAPITLWPWIKQRSRWIKGYMQTWLVHMRRPLWLWKTLGSRGFFVFQLFIGGPCIVFISTPILLLFSALWWVYPEFAAQGLHPLLLPISVMALIYGFGLHLLFAIHAVRSRLWVGMRGAVFAFPFYWLLHSIASFRALSQLITRPYYWEKTEHGVSLAPSAKLP